MEIAEHCFYSAFELEKYFPDFIMKEQNFCALAALLRSVNTLDEAVDLEDKLLMFNLEKSTSAPW